MVKEIARSVAINAGAAAVWEALTDPELINQWMGEPEMRIEVVTDWVVDRPILIRGFLHARFERS